MSEKKCSSCDENKIVPDKFSKTEVYGVIFGLYLLGSSIYGTIELIKKIIASF